MKTEWHSRKAAEATNGESTAIWTATGVSIDTRTIKQGDLFVALKGDKFDGHDYVAQAFAKGAVAAMVNRSFVGKGGPYLRVEDTYKGLADLAAFRRSNTDTIFIGITGSVGKTSVKEMLLKVLKAQAPSFGSAGNLNNHIGLPLSICQMPPAIKYGVFELGMNHPGEIGYLTDILRPDIAIITTVAEVHLEAFENIEAIALEKASIFRSMSEDGKAIIPYDCAQRNILEHEAQKYGLSHVLTFGQSSESLYQLLKFSDGKVAADIAGQAVSYSIEAPGIHQAVNSLAVMGAISALGLSLPRAAETISHVQVTEGRGKHYRLSSPAIYTLIDDSYNASPISVKAALAAISTVKERKIVVLGDMLELGEKSAQFHEELEEAVVGANVNKLFTIGSNMQRLSNRVPQSIRAGHADSIESLQAMVNSEIKENDVVLIKGSHGTGLWKMAENMKKEIIG